MSDQVPESEVAEPQVDAGSDAAGDAGTDPLFTDGAFEFGWHDGSRMSVADRGQLARELQKVNEQLRHSGMRHEELEGERRKLTESQRLMDQTIKDYRTKEQNLQTAYAEAAALKKALSERPGLQQKINQVIDEYNSGGGYASDSQRSALEAELKPIKSEIEEWKAEREAQRQEREFSKAAEALAGELEGFDAKAVKEYLDGLKSVPQADVPRKLQELAYYALQGQKKLADLESKKGPPKSPPNLVPSSGGKTKRNISEMSEAEQEAYAIELAKATMGS